MYAQAISINSNGNIKVTCRYWYYCRRWIHCSSEAVLWERTCIFGSAMRNPYTRALLYCFSHGMSYPGVLQSASDCSCDLNQVLAILTTSALVHSMLLVSQDTELVGSKVVTGLIVAGEPYSPFPKGSVWGSSAPLTLFYGQYYC